MARKIACVRCHKSKTKCIFLPNSSTCQRCKKMKSQCVKREAKKQRPKVKSKATKSFRRTPLTFKTVESKSFMKRWSKFAEILSYVETFRTANQAVKSWRLTCLAKELLLRGSIDDLMMVLAYSRGLGIEIDPELVFIELPSFAVSESPKSPPIPIPDKSCWISTWFVYKKSVGSENLFNELNLSDDKFVFYTCAEKFELINLSNSDINRHTPGNFLITRYIIPSIDDCIKFWKMMGNCIKSAAKTKSNMCSFSMETNVRNGEVSTSKCNVTWIMTFDNNFVQSQTWLVITPLEKPDSEPSSDIDVSTGLSTVVFKNPSNNWLHRFHQSVLSLDPKTRQLSRKIRISVGVESFVEN
eukprot:TRINITY_DN956_c0_g1_i4.p1 TRINITY_DN956_c0_g1~~TRINITY_DN956_c0_g1_i4.p1  ORF type:complete len:356 (-),score=53.35 TRINITY_DN956_c0_g1_i4:649-1716(-)